MNGQEREQGLMKILQLMATGLDTNGPMPLGSRLVELPSWRQHPSADRPPDQAKQQQTGGLGARPIQQRECSVPRDDEE